MHHDPEHEVAERWAIAFVRAGEFDITVGGLRHRLRRGSVFLTQPGMGFRCTHEDACPHDVCISIGFEGSAVAGFEHAWARAGWAVRESATPRLAHAQRRVFAAADAADAFELERWSLDALGALATDARDDRARGPYAPRRAELDAVIATCRAIETVPESRRSIAARARDVGMTAPRLTHAFRRYLGVSPHQYVVRSRLARAAALLDAGTDVSASCYGAGFENLSHFCRTFQRAYGVRASHWPRLPLRERRRKVQDLLRAAA